MSFQISLTPTSRAAGRFVMQVRRALQKALAEEAARRGLTQSDLARAIGVHRSIISRELNGTKDLTLGRVGELARALGRRAKFELPQTNMLSFDVSTDSSSKDTLIPKPPADPGKFDPIPRQL